MRSLALTDETEIRRQSFKPVAELERVLPAVCREPGMKTRVELEIDAQQAQVAELLELRSDIREFSRLT